MKPRTIQYRPKPYCLLPPPATLRRAHLDNLALVPANLLPYKKQWQDIANKLPPVPDDTGLRKYAVLILLPSDERPLHKTLETVATLLKADGHPVTTLPAEQFAHA